MKNITITSPSQELEKFDAYFIKGMLFYYILLGICVFLVDVKVIVSVANTLLELILIIVLCLVIAFALLVAPVFLSKFLRKKFIQNAERVIINDSSLLLSKGQETIKIINIHDIEKVYLSTYFCDPAEPQKKDGKFTGYTFLLVKFNKFQEIPKNFLQNNSPVTNRLLATSSEFSSAIGPNVDYDWAINVSTTEDKDFDMKIFTKLFGEPVAVGPFIMTEDIDKYNAYLREWFDDESVKKFTLEQR